MRRRGKLKQEASTLLTSIRSALHSCRGLSQSAPGDADAATLSAQCVVCMCADLDTAYYALLEHHLSCGYETPPVPPPHVYFPALAQAHPGTRKTCNPARTLYLSAVAGQCPDADMCAGPSSMRDLVRRHVIGGIVQTNVPRLQATRQP